MGVTVITPQELEQSRAEQIKKFREDKDKENTVKVIPAVSETTEPEKPKIERPPMYERVPDYLLDKLPIDVGHMHNDQTKWVNIHMFIVHRETGYMYVPHKALAFTTQPRQGQLKDWIALRKTATGKFIMSLIPEDTVFTIRYEIPPSDTHSRVDHLIFKS